MTELMDEGTTMNLSWFADRPGAWIFHCHLNFHVIPNPPARRCHASPIQRARARAVFRAGHGRDGSRGTPMEPTTPSKAWVACVLRDSHHSRKRPGSPYNGPRERLRLYIQTDSQPSDTARRFGYALARGSEVPAPDVAAVAGPADHPAQGQADEHHGSSTGSTEPSQVHWHGLEIDSYYDGVAGLSSNAGMVSPMIMPRDSFEVTVTPPRAGSFMYHTHINDLRQQSHGLYGPIVVLDQRRDAGTPRPI